MKPALRQICLVPALFVSTAQAQTSSGAGTPPALTTTRYNEDYGYLAQPAGRSGAWWERFKYVPIRENPEAYFSTGTEFRLRQESYRSRLWGGASDPDDGYVLARALPYLDLHLGPSVRAFAQLSVAYEAGASGRKSQVQETGLDLGQAFLELSTPLATEGTDILVAIRGGRRQLSFGAGRLVSPRYVPNVMQAFDGGFASLNIGRKWTIDAFYARPVSAGTATFDDETGTTSMYGLYTVRRGVEVAGGTSAVDLYYLGYRDADAAFDQGSAPETRHTLGARIAGKADNWDWDWEAMYQLGRFGQGRIRAWAVATRTAYTWKHLALSPRLMLEGSVVSGDRNREDDNLQTFNALFPNGNLFGELNPVGPYNLASAGATASAQVTPTVRVEAQSLLHWRESLEDGVYNVAGSPLRSGAGSRARHIGTQGSISATWAPQRAFDATLTYGMFDAGKFLKQTGPSETTHFVSAQARFRY